MPSKADICYDCGMKPGTCVAPKTKEWDDCKKNCSQCALHRCRHRNKCEKLYPKKNKRR